jgi:hypothetical protein
MIARHLALRASSFVLLVGVASCGASAESSGDTTGTNTMAATITGGVGGSTASTTGATATTGALSGCLATTLADGSLDLRVNAANNYAFESTVTLTVQQIAPNTPLHFDWSGLTTDITQQPIDATSGEVQAVVLALLELTPDAFQAKLNANERLTSYSNGAIAYYPTSETAANLHDFSGPGSTLPAPATEIDPYFDPALYPPATHTYAALVQDRKDPGKGVRMVQALQLDANSINTEVVISNDSSDLTYQTDLTAVVPVQVPAVTANITVDWESMQLGGLNALGDEWKKSSVNEVMIGHYMLTPQQLTEQFLGLENIASELYQGAVTAGAKLNLTGLTEATSGAAFAGIDGTGTWILTLNCNECSNPAPWFLTILQPCP